MSAALTTREGNGEAQSTFPERAFEISSGDTLAILTTVPTLRLTSANELASLPAKSFYRSSGESQKSTAWRNYS